VRGPTGHGIAPALGLRAGTGAGFIVPQTNSIKETKHVAFSHA
jgi:hypothetical protein